MPYVRVALWLLLLALLALGAAWWFGGRRTTHRAGGLIRATPDAVFRWITSPELLTQWMGGVVESTPQGKAELAVGAVSIETVEENGRRFTLETRVLEIVPGRHLKTRIEGLFIDATTDYRLEPTREGTRIVHELSATYRGATRVFATFVRSKVQAKLEADLMRLRDHVQAAEAQNP